MRKNKGQSFTGLALAQNGIYIFGRIQFLSVQLKQHIIDIYAGIVKRRIANGVAADYQVAISVGLETYIAQPGFATGSFFQPEAGRF